MGLQDALAGFVVGPGEELVVGFAAVGFEDEAVVGPEEVGDVAEQGLVGEWLREVLEEGVDEVFELVARGGSGGDDSSERFLRPRWLAVTSSCGLTSRWLRASLTALRSGLYGSIEERSISVRSGGVTGMPLWNVRSMFWLRWVRMPSCLRSVGAVTSGSR